MTWSDELSYFSNLTRARLFNGSSGNIFIDNVPDTNMRLVREHCHLINSEQLAEIVNGDEWFDYIFLSLYMIVSYTEITVSPSLSPSSSSSSSSSSSIATSLLQIPVPVRICIHCSRNQVFMNSLNRKGFSMRSKIHHEERCYTNASLAQDYNRTARCAGCKIYYTTMRGESLYNFTFDDDDDDDDGHRNNECTCDSDDSDNIDNLIGVKVVRVCSGHLNRDIRYAYHR